MHGGDCPTRQRGKSEWGAVERAWYRYLATDGRRRQFPGYPDGIIPPEIEIAEVAAQSGVAPWELAEHAADWLPILAARVSARNRHQKQLAEEAKRNQR